MTPENTKPFVSFCMSTYKRPQFLEKQLSSLLKQTYTNFEIIVSDNDPDNSGMHICNSFKDFRIKYYSNIENLGMIKSYNKSIDRSSGIYIVMITDDDPLDTDFLVVLIGLFRKYPNLSVYAGFSRKQKLPNAIELISPNEFLTELLDPDKTNSFLWSSCMVAKEDLLKVGKLPDYNSPHLFDHAMIAMVGSQKGGIFFNKVFGVYLFHENNFSKSNFDTYYIGCQGFHNLMIAFCDNKSFEAKGKKIIKKHLYHWFINNIFSLKKYYFINRNKYPGQYSNINEIAKKIMKLDFMKGLILKYKMKNFLFQIKKVSFF